MPAKAANDDQKATRKLSSDDLKRLPWRSVGPATMGGRVSDVCFEPGNPKAFLVAYATGGLWRTTNRGTTFEPIFDKEETSSIGSVVWTKPAVTSGRKSPGDEGGEPKGTIWVGTGEGNGRNSSSWGNGVYKSTDGGKKWQHLGLEDSHDIPRLTVDPRNPDVCYAACLGHLWGSNPTRGLYKTTDGGKTWKPILQIDDKTGCCDVILDPANPDTVYAAMYMRRRTAWSYASGGPEGGIYKSTDAGATWKKLSKGLPKQTGRIGLDIFLGDTKKLIAVIESTESGANAIRDDRMRGGGVFRSDDGGETWSRGSVRSPRAFYFSKVRFDPTNDQRVYMLGWTVEYSDDGGKTFHQGGGNILHADHHAIIVDPNDPEHLVIGTDGGVYQSFDKGKTYDFLNTMATGQFYNVSLDMSDPYRIIGGLQDNGTWIGPSATNRETEKMEEAGIPETNIWNGDWQVCFWGDGFHAEFDPENPDWVYAEWQGGHVTRVDTKTGEKRYLSPEAREGEARHRYNWNSPFFISKHQKHTIYHGGNYVYKINTRTFAWEKISPDLTTADPAKMETEGSNAETHCTVVSLCESPLASGVLWAGSDDGLIHVTKDEGKTWKNVTPKAVDGRYVSRLVASHHEKGRAYASIDGHRSDDMSPCVLVTEDFGKTWSDITGDLPKGGAVKVVREDMWNPNVLYAGTEKGIWISVDRGQSWIKAHGAGFPTVPVDDIKQHPRERDLVLGTHGRSIWVLDDASMLSGLTPEVMASPIHVFDTMPCKARWFLELGGLWAHKFFRAANPAKGVKINYWLREFTGDEVNIRIEDSKGLLMKELKGGQAPGLNRVTWDLSPAEHLQLHDENEEPFNKFHIRPGQYKIKVTMGDHSIEKAMVVLPRD
ncbi:MAG: hypothetical protein JNM34_10065 [Chthonomonadaceae bacterium]|nr:hypothetical protein [Chthonomonadaceae bacterium]